MCLNDTDNLMIFFFFHKYLYDNFLLIPKYKVLIPHSICTRIWNQTRARSRTRWTAPSWAPLTSSTRRSWTASRCSRICSPRTLPTELTSDMTSKYLAIILHYWPYWWECIMGNLPCSLFILSLSAHKHPPAITSAHPWSWPLQQCRNIGNSK